MPLVFSRDQLLATSDGGEFTFKRNPPGRSAGCALCSFFLSGACLSAPDGHCLPSCRRDGLNGHWKPVRKGSE